MTRGYMFSKLLILACLVALCWPFTTNRRHPTTRGFALRNATSSDQLYLVASVDRGTSLLSSIIGLEMKVSEALPQPKSPLLGRFKELLRFPFRQLSRLLRSKRKPLQAVQTEQEAPIAVATTAESVAHVDASVYTGRTATASVDLSGVWELVVTDEFKEQYDKYLKLMGLPYIVRSVAVNVIGMTKEEFIQSNNGRILYIKAHNVKGVWERTLTASGPVRDNQQFEPILTPIQTADGEEVLAEAWWEENGTVHHSWLRGGGKRYGGGSFESRRYLQDGGESMVCESIFHPNDPRREKPTMTWKFRRAQQEKN